MTDYSTAQTTEFKTSEPQDEAQQEQKTQNTFHTTRKMNFLKHKHSNNSQNFSREILQSRIWLDKYFNAPFSYMKESKESMISSPGKIPLMQEKFLHF